MFLLSRGGLALAKSMLADNHCPLLINKLDVELGILVIERRDGSGLDMLVDNHCPSSLLQRA